MKNVADCIWAAVDSRGLVADLPGGSGAYQYGIIDWPAPMRYGYVTTGNVDRTVVDALGVGALRSVAQTAQALGDDTTRSTYDDRADHLTAAMRGQLRDPATGGTFLWEQWTPGCADSDCAGAEVALSSGESFSHGWGGAGITGILEGVLGLTVTSLGAGTVRIAPADKGLAAASGTQWTERGTVGVDWRRGRYGVSTEVATPVNVTAGRPARRRRRHLPRDRPGQVPRHPGRQGPVPSRVRPHRLPRGTGDVRVPDARLGAGGTGQAAPSGECRAGSAPTAPMSPVRVRPMGGGTRRDRRGRAGANRRRSSGNCPVTRPGEETAAHGDDSRGKLARAAVGP